MYILTIDPYSWYSILFSLERKYEKREGLWLESKMLRGIRWLLAVGRLADILITPSHHERNDRLQKVSESSLIISIHDLVDELDV